ncbi:D-alanyl-D-alanine carboxypeptidase [candidate division WWE3 bacterium]|uniref:D-alanyl-D-alanine carboxypeptidase n=1 Tax=candidate division WWE3 bacterium TaxID=2053526 RepID=A0A928Y6D9_UNCKA|nr:D-alanyl-D-alanine carboxypeptidase [candidate division WWE3 bacterium]
MTLNFLVSILAAVAMNANPAPEAVPANLGRFPRTASRIAALPPIRGKSDSLGVLTTAKSAIVVDVGSGAVLYAKDAEIPYPIASLTKLLAAMVILDQGLRESETITIQESDFDSIGRRYFRAGESMSRDDAFRAMLISSVNELANAFARTAPGGREAFLQAMREKAATLGLRHATFRDASGIDPSNAASASDVARLFRSATAYPLMRDITGSGGFDLRTAEGRSIQMKPTNELIASYLNQDPYKVIIGKTGSLPEAGFCLGQVTRHPDGQEVIAVVLGSDNHFGRFQEVKALTAWAFDTFRWPRGEE